MYQQRRSAPPRSANEASILPQVSIIWLNCFAVRARVFHVVPTNISSPFKCVRSERNSNDAVALVPVGRTGDGIGTMDLTVEHESRACGRQGLRRGFERRQQRSNMPKVVITHKVEDIEKWLKGKVERA